MAKLLKLLPCLSLLCAMVGVVGCNVPPGQSTESSGSARLDSKSFVEAEQKIRDSAQTLSRFLSNQLLAQASYESMVLVELCKRLRAHHPSKGVTVPAEYEEFLGQARDLEFASHVVQHNTSLRLVPKAQEAMDTLITRYNRLSNQFGTSKPIEGAPTLKSLLRR